MIRDWYRLVGLATAILLLPAPGWTGAPGQGPAAMVGQKAPGFNVADIDGKPLGLEPLLARFGGVVVNFWGLRCSACLDEIPALNAIAGKYRDRIAVLGVNVDAIDAETLRKMLDAGGPKLSYAVVPDPDFKMIEAFRMVAAPLTVVIDGGGVVRYVHEDYRPGDEKELDGVLAGLPARARQAPGP